MSQVQRLKNDYPWIQTPLVVSAPMRLIALANMAVEVSKAGGIGFIGAGTDVSDLATHCEDAKKLLQATPIATHGDILPIGIGFINWGANLTASMPIIKKYKPAAVWLFAPSSTASLADWAQKSRNASPRSKIWVQIGSVKDALDAVKHVTPDVLVVQGTDAGGHGLAQGASLISLLPEVCDAVSTHYSQSSTQGSRSEKPIILAAGGIAESRGATAAFTLGASGVILGTRFLATFESNISPGYRAEVLRASDGGQSTVRTKVYDSLRGTNWAETHNARGIVNKSYTDAMVGMSDEENRELYNKEMEKGDQGWGIEGRMTTYAGSAVGLVREVMGAGDVVREVREGIMGAMEGLKGKL